MQEQGNQQSNHDAGQPTSEQAVTNEKLLTSDKIALLVGLITYGIGQSVLFIVLQPLVEKIGLSLREFGFIMGLSNLALAVSAVYWGRKSDQVGRKPMLIFGLFGYALGSAMVALCLEWGLRGSPEPLWIFSTLLIARLVYGCLASAINPSATAYMADTTTRAQRSQGMALIGMTAGLGTLFGPLLGGLFTFISPVAPMYVAIVLALFAMLLIGMKVNEPKRHAAPAHESTDKLAWRDARVRPFLVLLVFFWLSFTMIQIITAFYIEKQIGIEGITSIQQAMVKALVCMAILAVLMQVGVIQFLKIQTRTLFRVGLPIFLAGLTVLYFSTNIYWLCASFSLLGASMALANAGIAGAASLSVAPHEQGAVGGLLSAAPIMGMVLGPLLGTTLFEAFGPTAPVAFCMAIFTVLSLYALTIAVPDVGEKPLIKKTT